MYDMVYVTQQLSHLSVGSTSGENQQKKKKKKKKELEERFNEICNENIK